MTPVLPTVDARRCCGYGNCVDLAPEMFRLSAETNLAEVIGTTPLDPDLLARVVADCPAGAVGTTSL